jgi:hypothetical protein
MSLAGAVWIRLQGKPEVGRSIRYEGRAKHADNLKGSLSESNRLANKIWVSVEAVAPESVAYHNHMWAPRTILVSRERPAHRYRRAEYRKVTG